MRLMREVRCFPAGELALGLRANSWGGTPNPHRLDSFWVFRVVMEGPVDPGTGYVCGLAAVDRLIREKVVPSLYALAREAEYAVGPIVKELHRAFESARLESVGSAALHELEWRPSPFLSFSVRQGEPQMVCVTHSFEFAASHRLYRPDWTVEENLRIFGKCAHANGHGHNYVLEVSLTGPTEGSDGGLSNVAHVQRVVKERVLDTLDHKHLNLDCPDFAALNPTVENIARVIWRRLVNGFEGCRLVRVRVWETPKTYAEYDGVDP